MLNTSQEPPAPIKASNQGLKDMDVPCTLKNQDGAKNRSIGKSKTSDHIQIKIKMLNPSQEPPASSKAQNQGLKLKGAMEAFAP